MPFQVPAGHWIKNAAPSGSVPFTVVTDPVPPHVCDAASEAAGQASPATTRAAENPTAATLLLIFTTTLHCETTVMNDASSLTVDLSACGGAEIVVSLDGRSGPWAGDAEVRARELRQRDSEDGGSQTSPA